MPMARLLKWGGKQQCRKTIRPLSKLSGRWLRTYTCCQSVLPLPTSYVGPFCAFFAVFNLWRTLHHNQSRATPLKHQAAASTLPPTLPSPRSKPLPDISKRSGQALPPRCKRSVALHRYCPPTAGIASPSFLTSPPRQLRFTFRTPMPGDRCLHLPTSGLGHQPPPSRSALPPNSPTASGPTLCEQCGRSLLGPSRDCWFALSTLCLPTLSTPQMCSPPSLIKSGCLLLTLIRNNSGVCGATRPFPNSHTLQLASRSGWRR